MNNKYQVGDVIQTLFRKGYISELPKEFVMITWLDDETGRSFVYSEDEVDIWLAKGDAKHYPVVK